MKWGNLAKALQLFSQILTSFLGYVGGLYLLARWLQDRGTLSSQGVMVLVFIGFVLAMIQTYKLAMPRPPEEKKQSETDGKS